MLLLAEKMFVHALLCCLHDDCGKADVIPQFVILLIFRKDVYEAASSFVGWVRLNLTIV